MKVPSFRSLLKLFWLLIPALLWLALRRVSFTALFDALGRLGVAQILLLLLVNSLIILLISTRLWVLLRARGHKLPLLACTRYWLVGFAASYFTPGPQFGGGPFQVYYLQRRHAIALSEATAAVVVSKVLERLANSLFLLFGIGVLLRFHLLSRSIDGLLVGTGLVLLVLPAVYLIAARSGHQPLTATLHRLPGSLARSSLYQKLLELAENSESEVVAFAQHHLLSMIMGITLTLASWAFILLESWLALVFLGTTFDWTEIVAIVAASQISFLTPLPGGLGAFEAAVILVIQAFGYAPALGASLVVLVRLRDILIGGVGIALGGWMAFTSPGADLSGPVDSSLTRAYFDRIAPFYDFSLKVSAWLDGVRPRQERYILVQHLELKPGQRVLEVAVGTGSNLEVILNCIEFPLQLHGIDLSTGMLQRARRKLVTAEGSVNLIAANADDLPFPPDSFDVVFHFGGINHFACQSCAMDEIVRVARPGGTVVISDKSLVHRGDRSLRYRLLAKLKPQLLQPPPFELIPVPRESTQLSWFWNHTTYLLKFKNP